MKSLTLRWLFLVSALLSGLSQSCARVETSDTRKPDSTGSEDEYNISRNSSGRSQLGNGKVYIVCFYGGYDHDQIAERKCQEFFRECIQRYGRDRCVLKTNPSRQEIARLGEDGIVIVIGHSTPCSISPDKMPNENCGIDIWDTPVSPKDINDNKGDKPVIWYGCFGKSAADQCPNVIPLQDRPQVLDSRDPAVSCRVKASMICWEKLASSGKNPTRDEILACVRETVPQLIQQRDPMCSMTGPNAPLPPAPAPAPSAPGGTTIQAPTR